MRENKFANIVPGNLLLAQLLDCAEENETRASHDKKQHCRLLHNTMGLDRETLLDLQICAGRVAGNEERTHRVALEEKTWGATHTLPVLLLLNSMNIFDTFKGNRIFFFRQTSPVERRGSAQKLRDAFISVSTLQGLHY